MKTTLKLPALLLGLMLLFAGTTQKAMAQTDDVSLQSFYDELSPYGTWIQDPQYGYVWRPDVDQEDFRPYYSNGRWAMTEYGNTWVSNYDWGWAPFHYGRWVYNRYNQWIWIPDTIWGPAWVSWRSGGGYYGWAPLGPTISIGINIGHGGYRIPDMCWNFIPYGQIYYNSYPRYYASRNRVYINNTVIINNTYVRNNRTYYTGPRAEEVRRVTNQNVTVYNVNRASRPGASRVDNNNVNIYTPRPSRGDNSNAAPRNVVQGNINRGPVSRDGRDNTVTAGRADRGNVDQNNRNGGFERNNGNMNRADRENGVERNGSITTRPGRGENPASQNKDNNGRVGVAPTGDNNSVVNQRPSVFGRDRNESDNSSSQRAERTQPAQAPQQRVERPEPQRMERPQVERPQVERPQPQPRMERPQMERPQVERPQSQPQRVERSQPAPQRNSGGGESRGSRGEGGGRPGRG